MKKLLIVLVLLATSTSVLADGHGHYYRHSNSDWLAPLIVGGVVGYVISQPRQQTVIVQQPVYQPLPQYVPAEPIYQYQDMYDTSCRCYRRVLVQIN
jgi:hypothetical protein